MAVKVKLVAAVVGGLLLATTYAPAWAQSANPAAQSTGVVNGGQYMLGVITPLLNNTAPHVAQKKCKADSLYSAHDVVGDSDACFLNKLDARGTAAAGFGIF